MSPLGRAERPLRILVLHSSYLSGAVSGENRVVEDEIRLLRERGHDVVAWTPSPTGGKGGWVSVQQGIQAVWSAEAGRELRGFIGKLRPHVIHAHNLFPMLSPAIIRAANRESVPFVLTLHNYRLMCLPATFFRNGRPCEDCLGRVPWPGVVHRCFRGAAGSATLASSITLHRTLGTFEGITLFLAVSRFMLEKHVQAGISPQRIVHKPNFAWPTARRSGSGRHFLYLGRLSREKGVRTLARAWRSVDAPLVVAGDGELRPELERTSPSTVEFLGPVDHAKALDLVKSARALILPSLWYEGAPRSIAEAYAAGVPVIASRIGSIPEFVEDGRSGCLVSPGDSGSLAEAAGALRDDDRCAELGEGAHGLWRERFTPERGVLELESAYETAIARGPGRR
jgi:glycosyltransferase involved in cell wall biosynthesis